ncbi:MAG: RsmD family RNA methyltransferase [Bacteroidia bacterium]|nr:RsmD family RNA methyltransferase [Bacteroidia bacterium]MDW8088439.1 RsmD family RNA methyltransferase [Bacteroidia bacterium]
MRILQGKWRGRAIPFPAGTPTRPLTGKAREALFQILAHHWRLTDSCVLDLFAGSGSVGLEFLSRGAAQVVFVEVHPIAASHLRRVVEAWAVADRAHVYEEDVLAFLRRSSTPMDFIFAGPPFRYWPKRTVAELILTRNWLKPGGCFILEHPPYEDYSDLAGFWQKRRYVTSCLSFFVA